MVQREHINSILLTLTENVNNCLYFFSFGPENPPTLCSFLVKMNQSGLNADQKYLPKTINPDKFGEIDLSFREWTHPSHVLRCSDLQEDMLGEPLEMAFGEQR